MRTIIGTLLTVDGLPLASTEVTFSLVNNQALPTTSFDAITYDRIYGSRLATTDSLGNFTIELYENSKLIDITFYLVKVDIANDIPFIAALSEGVSAIDWLEFKANGETLTPATLLIYENYVSRAENASTLAEADRVATAADRVVTTADRAQTTADRIAMEALFDNFDDRFLGSKAVNPTLDNDGNALSAGAVYWNTTVPEVRFYNGAIWEAPTASATTSATNALASELAAEADRVATVADRVQTGLDRVQTGLDRVATNSDKIVTTTKAAESVTSATASQAARLGSESARDASLIQAGVYTTEALGRAAVADGQAFKVQGSGDVAAYEYRRVNAATVSTLIATYPSISYIKDEIARLANGGTTGAYGVEWNSATDTYVRVGATDVTQIQRLMKRCVLNANGTVNYYLDPLDSNKKADGTASDLTGLAGNVMVEIPAFYSKKTYVNGIHSIMVSLVPATGYTLEPAFNRGGVTVAYRYYRAYKGYLNGTVLISRSGVIPTRSRTLAQFRADAVANGVGWSQVDWTLLSAVQTLFLTEHATFNTQSILGNGNDTGGDYGTTTGQSNAIGNRSSSNLNNNSWMSYRGIENWYADAWEFIDGINVSERIPFVNNALPASYVSDTFTGNYVSTGLAMPASSGSYIKNFHLTDKGFIASTVGGASSTYITDGLWTNIGSRVMTFSGYASYGLLDGGFCLNADYDSAIVASSIGSGVSF